MREGHAVTAFDMNPRLDVLGDLAAHVDVVQGDVRDFTHLFRTMESRRIERVVHLAAATADTTNPFAITKVNGTGTENVFVAAQN